MLNLQLREIGATLSDQTQAPHALAVSVEDSRVWHDSSLDLQRGLEVVEMSIELLPGEPAEAIKSTAQGDGS